MALLDGNRTSTGSVEPASDGHAMRAVGSYASLGFTINGGYLQMDGLYWAPISGNHHMRAAVVVVHSGWCQYVSISGCVCW